MKPFSYGRNEKLKSRKRIESLFAAGRSFSVFPLKVFYSEQPETDQQGAVQAGVGVSSRNFKKAVHRNRIKRLLREAYRLQKTELYASTTARQRTLALFILYVGKEMPEQELIFQKMRVALNKLADHVNGK